MEEGGRKIVFFLIARIGMTLGKIKQRDCVLPSSSLSLVLPFLASIFEAIRWVMCGQLWACSVIAVVAF